MKKIISLLILIVLLISSLSVIESRLDQDEEPFMEFDDNMMLPLIISAGENINEYTISSDITKGVVVFWETSKNNTLVYGQFSKGFVEGEEDNYSFKVYKGDQELVDLKPKDDDLDRILKINPNGSTDLFLFVFNDTLISGVGILDTDLVISTSDSLIGKDRIKPLTCW
ncbi:7757_t:CDS:2 [Rhizophagus irregularis]|nr:7757_t:CDS:2 [Rhizophagus irregularis]